MYEIVSTSINELLILEINCDSAELFFIKGWFVVMQSLLIISDVSLIYSIIKMNWSIILVNSILRSATLLFNLYPNITWLFKEGELALIILHRLLNNQKRYEFSFPAVFWIVIQLICFFGLIWTDKKDRLGSSGYFLKYFIPFSIKSLTSVFSI